jgi:hypothetical protein
MSRAGNLYLLRGKKEYYQGSVGKGNIAPDHEQYKG